ncbi:MBL fold metallo-hydrolase [Neisseriaceae bacterium TC5R-5]|nr:MBL fold metallo-hydrolase [Neisseriaceae bacterium TC5R-5]
MPRRLAHWLKQPRKLGSSRIKRHRNLYAFQQPRLRDVMRWHWQRGKQTHAPHRLELIPRTQPDLLALQQNRTRSSVTWIGHASSLIQLAGLNVLIDPIWSQRASPVQWAGPKRQVPLPMQLHELPAIDLVLISHNHYDHLDFHTIQQLVRLQQHTPQFVVPAGLRRILRRAGVANHHIHELGWWDSYRYAELEIILTPAHHWSKRWLIGDENRALWGGFAIRGAQQQLWFPGDTGYHQQLFQQIGTRLGAIDLALLPIGAYEPRWFLRQQHVNPAEAVQILLDVGAHHAWAVHWGTFILTDEPIQQPMIDLQLALQQQGIASERFQLPAIGETRWL